MSDAATHSREAIAAWRAALAPDQVRDDDATLDRYARSSAGKGTRPCAVLFPACTEEVQAIVRVAARHGVVVYPISRGKNWGYGDACAPAPGAAIVDLSRMNRIVEVNTELAYAVVEPGVTQQQLYTYLQAHAPGLWMDCTGAGLEASVVGNALDRGFGHTRYADHAATSCGMEIVLADGRILHTGFDHFHAAAAARTYRYGVGPALDGLFTQSNLGIVTRMGVWLMPAPEAFCFFYIRVPRHEDLVPLVDALRPLRMAGLLPSALHIANDLRLISATQRYPWERARDETPLPEALRKELRAELTVGAWMASGSIAGSRAHVRATARAVRKALRHVAAVRFVNDRTIAWAERAASTLWFTPFGKRVARQLQTLKPNYGLLKGIPTNEPLRGAQWRLREAPAAGSDDPLDSSCGIVWLSPVVPMTGRDAARMARCVEPLFAKYGFDALITFSMVNERAMVAVLNAAFDRSVPGEAERANAWYEETLDALLALGYVPYRVSPQSMPRLREAGDVFWSVAGEIKRALDPGDIIARGRYIGPLEPGRDPFSPKAGPDID